MICRFENRLADQAIVLSGPRERVAAHRPEDLPEVYAAAARARRNGRWVALLAEYELGEWLLPESTRLPAGTSGASSHAGAGAGEAASSSRPRCATPRLTVLAYEHAAHTTPWAVLPDDGQAGIVSARPAIARDAYLRRVGAVRDMIGRGELYQLNYTFPMDVQTRGAPDAVYRQLASRHASAHAAYIEDEGRTVLSFSPELFLQRSGSRVVTRPMKGTAPRFDDAQADRASGQALVSSEKNRAENLMIVDLLRNDLGRLAPPGGVHVDALFTLEQYPSVWTLTSTVSADLPGCELPQILANLFPCGSITGAPKVAAMQHIRVLEDSPRGLYCGAIGWLAPDGDFSLNVAIRTLVLDRPDRGQYRVGGGIVFDSDPALEWEECLWKARVITA